MDLGKKDVTMDEDSSDTEAGSQQKERMQFTGSCSFLVSLLGYSMGTSDFWRFPYLVFRNGGGAFLIPFAIFMLLCGLPMLFFEVTTSQFSGCGPISMWNMAPFFKGIGVTLLIINLINNVYYNVLRAWIFEYLINTFQSQLPWQHCTNDWNKPGCIELKSSSNSSTTGNATLRVFTSGGNQTEIVTQMTAAEQYWQFKVLQLSPGLGHFDGVLWHFVLYVFIWRLLVTLCMIRSIKSIEKVMFATVFLPMILMLVIFIRSLTLDGATVGILYYITPTFDRITDIKVWLEAALMATYTLGPGWGTIPMIGSHNKFNGNTIRYSIISTFLDFLSAVVNGLICFAILGVMAHDSGLKLENTVSSGLSLGFTVYPTAFTYFPLPQVWSAVFFINITLVGLDSQRMLALKEFEEKHNNTERTCNTAKPADNSLPSVLIHNTVLSTETVMNCLQDIHVIPNWFKGRRRLCMIVVLNVCFFLLTIPFCTRGGIYVFQLVDWYAAAWTLLFVCFMECIVFTWIYGCDRINKDLTIMIGHPMPVPIRLMGAFVTPLCILVLLIVSFIRYAPPTYGCYEYPYSAEITGWCLACAIVSPIFIVFIVRFVTAQGSLSEKLQMVRKPSVRWGPNDDVAMATYQHSVHDVLSSDKINQPNGRILSTLKFNATGRSCNTLRQHYTINACDEKSFPMIKKKTNYDSSL